MTLDDYITEEKIVTILCRYRANIAGKRHDLHMVRNFSIHPRSNTILKTQKNNTFTEVAELFPTRNNWRKLYRDERNVYKDSFRANQVRLFNSYKRTKREVDGGAIAPDWYTKLLSYVNDIQNKVLSTQSGAYAINPPRIKGIKKDVKNDVINYRPIAIYDTKSKIICSVVAKYFTDYFEPIFLDCSHAFRAKNSLGKIPTHHDCIKKIVKKRKDCKELFVAECDIQKFYDIVNHKHLIQVFDRISEIIRLKTGNRIDQNSREIFLLFLKSYSFQSNVYDLNSNLKWFEDNKLPVGKFGWIESELKKEFGSNYIVDNPLGVPQGNAISCFVANLILHDVDEKVTNCNKDVFYVRYCDDMILMHSDKSECQKALEVFMTELKNNFLLYHNPISNINYKQCSKTFWDSKSKLPFLWDDKNKSPFNIPWLSFVGYQVNFDGRIRVRKKTIIKETKKQVSETQKVILNLGKLTHFHDVKNQHSRWSTRQIRFSLQQRLISMSVGRIKLYNHVKPTKQGLCWTNGFKMLNNNSIVSKQLRYLDRRRRHQMLRLKYALSKVTRESKNAKFKDDKTFYGSAFSYFNFLKHK